MTVFLCGFMGCGKTTSGKELAKILGTSYTDSDEYIVKKTGLPIPQIFEKSGETYFRKIEAEAIAELSLKKGVVACGGGAMLNSVTAEIARKSGIVIFLDVPFEVCYERISGDTNRPIVMSSTKEQLKQRFDERYPIYKANSSFTVEADKSPVMISKEIAGIIKSFGGFK